MLNKILAFLLVAVIAWGWWMGGARAETRIKNQELRIKNQELSIKNETVGWNGWNGMRVLVKTAVDKGVPEETIVMLLLLPVVATMVGVVHYLVGLTGYGIFMPTMIAVVLAATGIPVGLMLFGLILLISVAGNAILRRFRLHFWPARSINLVMISLGTFGLMLMGMVRISIFPVLFMIMLAEEFVRTQLIKSKKEAIKLTLGTLALAAIGAALMEIGAVRSLVIENPEVVLVMVVVNIMVGNYSGIRLTEIARFRKAIRKKQERGTRNKVLDTRKNK